MKINSASFGDFGAVRWEKLIYFRLENGLFKLIILFILSLNEPKRNDPMTNNEE